MKTSKTPNWSNWCTPEPLLDLIRLIGPIGLDPCSNPASKVNARVNLSLENGDDGLIADWYNILDVEKDGFINEFVFVNPPYGDALKLWAKKIQFEAERECPIILLCPPRTDTKWWHKYIVPKKRMPFGHFAFEGRWQFDNPPPTGSSTNNSPSWLTFYNIDDDRFNFPLDELTTKGYYLR